MNKFLTRIVGATLGFAMAIGVGAGIAGRKVWPVYATEATMNAGTNGSACTVNGKDGIKIGTSKAGGDMTITVGAGATSLSLYAAAWKGVTGLSLNITGATVSPSSISLTADDGISNNSPFTLSGAESNFEFEITLSNITTQTTLTFTTSTAKRCAVWGATYETGSSGGSSSSSSSSSSSLTPTTYTVTYHETNKTSGSAPVDNNNYETGNSVTVLGNTGSLARTGYTWSGWSLNEDGSGTAYGPAPYTTTYTVASSDINFYPIWTFDSKDYALCTSVNDLEVGANYIITNAISGSAKAMATTDKADNRPSTDVTISNSKVATTSTTLTLALGGSAGAWTFYTNNYLGTAGYFAPSTGDNNKLRVVAEADTCTISFNGNAAVITFSSNPNNRNIVRYNGGIFSCYASGQDPVYLWKEFKQLSSLNVTGSPTKLSYYDSESFDPTGITAYQAVYSDASTKDISASNIVWPALTVETTQIKGSYTELGITVYTPTYNITVLEDSLSTVSLSGTMTASYFMDESWNKGSIVVTATYLSGQENIVTNDSTFTYYSDSAMTEEVATPADLGPGENQTVYVKATYSGVSNTSGYAQTVTITYEHGTIQSDPLTVAEAVTIGSALTHNTETSKQYYISGVVGEVTDNDLGGTNNWATFWIKNGDVVQGFEVYRIQAANGCTNYSDLRVGAEVLINCKIKRYSSTIETGSVKSLISIDYTPITLTGISLNKTALDLVVGEEDTLTVSPIPFGADIDSVSWTSSNSNVATVDQDGNVVAVANGSATITATAGGFTATCNVTVSLKDTMEYNAGTTTNMGATGNAATVNLDDNLFTVDADKGGNQNFPGLNKDGDIRAYSGNDIIVTIASDYTITSVEFDYASGDSYSQIYVDGAIISRNGNVYVINSDSFRIHANAGTIKINSVDIFYRDATAVEKVSRLDTTSSLSYTDYHDEGDGTFTYENLVARFKGQISKTLWDALDSESTILSYGLLFTAEDVIDNDNLKDYYSLSTNYQSSTNAKSEVINYTNVKATPNLTGNTYGWSLRKVLPEEDINTTFVAVAYIVTEQSGVIFMDEVRASIKSLAAGLIADGTYESTAFGGSLAYLAQ